MDIETKLFFEKHKISENEIINAKGQNISSLYDFMKSNQKLFAYNSTLCYKGHSIRDRSGHCIVCNTASIAFLKRSLATGNVYIAGSIKKGYIKIGMSTVPLDNRFSRLNSRKVGNTDDWVLLKSFKCHNANIHEFEIHKLLKKYKVDGDKYGDTESTEIFRCSFEKADTTINEYFDKFDIQILEKKKILYNTENYRFRNLVNPKNI